MTDSFAAVDLGATSGRVMVGRVGPGELDLHQAARFPNGPVHTPDGLHWGTQALFAHALDGLRAALGHDATIASIGVDSWAVDYALLHGNRILGEPYHHRDSRCERGVERVHAMVPFEDLYARNGLQFLVFNTAYQLAAEEPRHLLEVADSMLLIPDLMGFYLTGVKVAERTNASTTGLLNINSGHWDTDLARIVGASEDMLPRLVDAGTTVGSLLPHLRKQLAIDRDIPVVTVGSHDTASAVVAAPMVEADSAYISCGTWGLVGVETEAPVLTAHARESSFTNEGGVDGRTRFLHNVMGLWLLNESVAHWERESGRIDLERLLAEAAAVTSSVTLFDVNDPRFMAPGNIPARIGQWCAEHDVAAPTSPAEVVRSIVESLAQAFAATVRQAGELSGQRIQRIHIVGGGSLNALLCQRTADRAGLPVIAGPVEATAVGNILIQARAHGAVRGTLESLRALVRDTHTLRTFTPEGR
jgi:rhamnulokinase